MEINDTTGVGVIYKLTSPSGKVYIGQSINFKERLKKYRLNSKKSIGAALHAAIEKYGIDKFDISILCSIELDDDIEVTKAELDRLEVYYIEKYNSYGVNGYNLTAGGGGSFKRFVSNETRKKLSDINSGKNIVDSTELVCPICGNIFYLKPFKINQRLRNNKDISTIS